MTLIKDQKSKNEAALVVDNGVNAKITRYVNADQTLITITEDKLELCLIKSFKAIQDRKFWLMPFGVFVALLLVFLSTENFKNFLSIPASVWQTGCYLAMGLFLFWTVKAVYDAWKSRKITVNSIIEETKKNKVNPEQSSKNNE